jgi:hypothetical protein
LFILVYYKMIVISIGLQCTNTAVIRNLGKKKFTYPFDWIFATPKFVYTMLKFY